MIPQFVYKTDHLRLMLWHQALIYTLRLAICLASSSVTILEFKSKTSVQGEATILSHSMKTHKGTFIFFFRKWLRVSSLALKMPALSSAAAATPAAAAE
jgi:hypothetical protein